MAVAIVGTPQFGTWGAATNTTNITIPSTTAGNTLVLLIQSYSTGITGVTGWGAARQSVTGAAYHRLFVQTNISGGVTSLTVNWSGYTAGGFLCIELSGADTTDSHDVSSIVANGYNVTNLGTGSGSVTTTAAGMVLALFQEGYAAATGCTYASPWTTGTYDNTAKAFYEYQTSTASTTYGDRGGQRDKFLWRGGEHKGSRRCRKQHTFLHRSGKVFRIRITYLLQQGSYKWLYPL
jgi:hypothetical protein